MRRHYFKISGDSYECSMVLGHRFECVLSLGVDGGIHCISGTVYVQPWGTGEQQQGLTRVTLLFAVPKCELMLFLHGGFQEGMKWYHLVTPWTALAFLLLLISVMLRLL